MTTSSAILATPDTTVIYIHQMVVLHNNGKDRAIALLYCRHPEGEPVPTGAHPDELLFVSAIPVWQLPKILQQMAVSAPWIATTAHTLKKFSTRGNPEGVRYYPA